jgi:cytochrome d ubiquinol oxidase subunit I
VVRLSHTVMGCWQAGAFLVLSVSAYYLLRKQHEVFAKASIKVALTVALFASLMQLLTGSFSADVVTEHQPAKLAALEGHYKTGPGSMYLFGWVNEKEERVDYGIEIPGMLSLLAHGDPEASVTGLDAFAPADRPPVNVTFQFYHLMIAVGMALIALSLAGTFLWWRGTLFNYKWYLGLLVLSVMGPQIANQCGWFAAEVGRQPWIVYNLLRTSEGLSKVVTAEHIIASLIMFSFIYLLLFAVFVFLLNEKIKHGPSDDELPLQIGRKQPLAEA